MPTTARTTPVVVIGSGLAGLYAALRAAEYGDVMVVTRGRIEESSSWYAQGGVAAALGGDDTVELHEADTLRVGRGLCRPEAVEALVEEGPAHVKRLRALGVDFDRAPGGELALTLEAGHSRRRIAHAGGGGTGRVIIDALVRRVLEHDAISVCDDTTLHGFISDGERCFGVHTSSGAILAGTTVLATGGTSSLYARTTNPAGSRGQGVAHAWRAGADIADMEFIQFHPTATYLPGTSGDGFLISEALRGEGAHLLNAAGDRFMLERHPDAELAPRDELSRAILDELREDDETCVFLSMAHLDADHVRERFSTVANRLIDLGLDLAVDRIPVAPAAHYTMGGVATDTNARTSLRGLLACGEVACTGVHGANRLASNSLLECLVFADRAGREPLPFQRPSPGLVERPALRVTDTPPPSLEVVRELLWKHAGVARNANGLIELLEALGDDADKLPNRALVAYLIATAALTREESRGAHYRTDFPSELPEWQKHVVQRRGTAPRAVD